MINVTISGIEEAKRKLEQEIKRIASDKTVLVGIHEDAGSTDDGDLTMAQLGAIQHFGTQTIPARPWLMLALNLARKIISKLSKITVMI